MPIKKWQQLRTKIVLDTPYFKVRQDACRLPDGYEIDDYYVLETVDVAMVVAVTPSRSFVLVEQYKHGIGEVCLELPGGRCEAETADPINDARRELREETGYASDVWHKLATFAGNATRSNMRIHMYLALDAYPAGDQALDPTENIQIHHLPEADIMPALREGRIQVTDSVAGLMLALDWLTNQ